VLFCLATAPCLGSELPRSLQVFPARVRLNGPDASQRLVVVGTFADGSAGDVTGRVVLAPARPGVVKIADGHLRPAGDDSVEVVVKLGAAEARVPVEVKNARAPRVVSFRNEVVPALTRLGCNVGACHGSQHGKGGFKLSLLGFEAPPDHTAIVKSAEGRRVTPFAPEESLLLLKATLQVAHGGGKKLDADSADYELIRLWLEQGAPGPAEKDPEVTSVTVLPPRRVMEPDQAQRLVVMATLSDGTERDVTDHARFDSLNEGVAKVDAAGRAKTVGQGQAYVMALVPGPRRDGPIHRPVRQRAAIHVPRP
jgi:hypothetical protein